MTKKPLPIGIDNFKKIVDGNYYLIDKTLLIKDLVTRGSAVYLLPRPRRFGKTLNLHMLQCFFEKPLPRLHNPKGDSLAYLFEDKLVWQHEDLRALQGKFPIIALSFKDIKPLDWETCMRQCADVVAQEYQVHRYLLEDNVLSREEKAEFEAVMTKTGDFVAIQSSLSNLSRYLQRYHGVNVIILIDEYDAPIHAGYLYGFYDKIVSFMRTFFSSAFKGNHALERGIITGILRTAKEGIFSGPNNLDVYSNLDRFVADKFGFTQEEVDALLAYYRMTDQRDEIRKWYDGYRVPGTDLALYNPWSVLNCVQKEGVIAPYWANTSSHDLIKKQLTKVPAKILRELDLILQGNTEQRYPVSEGMVFPNMERTESAVWSLLVFSGYLTVSSIKFGNVDFLCTLNVPNQELYVLYKKLLENIVQDVPAGDLSDVLEALVTGEVSLFVKRFTTFFIQMMSFYDIPSIEPERSYHLFVLGMLTPLQENYIITSNRESGKGRYDITLEPRDHRKLGIVIEFKKVEDKTPEETVESALVQIKEKNYAAGLRARGVQDILAYGIAVEGKAVLVKAERV